MTQPLSDQGKQEATVDSGDGVCAVARGGGRDREGGRDRMSHFGRYGANPSGPPNGPAAMTEVKRHIVWVCAGCDKCQPLDGSERQSYPCTDTSPSMDGATVVRAEDYDRMRDEAEGERYIQGIYRAALEQVRHCAAAPGGLSVPEMQREIVGIVDSVIGPVNGETLTATERVDLAVERLVHALANLGVPYDAMADEVEKRIPEVAA